jgi:hypothetical protein
LARCITGGAFDAKNAKAALTVAEVDLPVGVRRARFQTDSFAGAFSAKHNPFAHILSLMRKDLEHLVKFGTALHSEVFCTGVRLRRADGLPHATFLPHGAILRKHGPLEAFWTLRNARPPSLLRVLELLRAQLSTLRSVSS